MRHLTLALVLTFPIAAQAQRGWVCTEANGLQKYRVDGMRLYPEGDPFSRLLEQSNRATGKPFEPLFIFNILIDDKHALVAVMANVDIQKGARTEVYTHTLMIEKETGRFRHIDTNISDPGSNYSGTCTNY